MRVLLTGASGQLGRELRRQVPPDVELIPTSREGGVGLLALDLSDMDACHSVVLTYRPDWVINAGAYTAVDRAESEPELAFNVNAKAPRVLAAAVAQTGGRLMQISTDFVFDGRQSQPYKVNQTRNPLNVYGQSKALGEEAVQELLADSLILRTSWVVSSIGRNFALTALKLHKTQDSMNIVCDQIGCPTSVVTLAEACWRCIQNRVTGIHHWSDLGTASWYDVAVAVGEIGIAAGLLNRVARVNPITSEEYAAAANRPKYSLLDCCYTRECLNLQALHWKQSLSNLFFPVI